MNFLLKTSLDAGTIVMLVVLSLLVVLMIVGQFKRKKLDTRMHEMRNDLKEGDKVLTDTGIFGVVVSKREQKGYNFVTIKTGDDNNFGYLEVMQEAICYNLNNEEEKMFEKLENDVNSNETSKSNEKKVDNKDNQSTEK